MKGHVLAGATSARNCLGATSSSDKVMPIVPPGRWAMSKLAYLKVYSSVEKATFDKRFGKPSSPGPNDGPRREIDFISFQE